MEPQVDLRELLRNTLDENPTLRGAAEKHLNELVLSPGWVVLLFQVACGPAAPQDAILAQVAAVTFKNAVQENWHRFAGADTAAIKEQMLPALASSPNLVRAQLMVALKRMVLDDFPGQWPTLVPSAMQLLGSPDSSQAIGALIAFRVLAQRFADSDTDGVELKNMLQPVLLQILQYLKENTAIDAGDVTVLVLKIFLDFNSLALSEYICNPANLGAWVAEIAAILQKQIPPEMEPAAEELKPRFTWWKAKKWAMRIFSRFVTRHGQPKICREEGKKQFAKHFLTNYAPAITNQCIVFLQQRSQGAYFPPKMLVDIFNVIDTSISHSICYKHVVKPHLQFLITDAIQRELLFNEDDEQVYELDPAEYLRRSLDINNAYESSRISALNVIIELHRLRSTDALPILSQFVLSVFGAFQQNPNSVQLQRQADGAAYAFGAVAELVIAKSPETRTFAESVLHDAIEPLFAFPLGFLRARACWVYGSFAELNFARPGHLDRALSQLISLLNDQETAVRIQSLHSIRLFIELSDNATERMRPMLPQLLNKLFESIHEVGSDDVISSVDVLVRKYQDDIVPYAADIAQHLVAAFFQLYESDENDDNAAIAAKTALGVIASLLASLENSPAALAQVEPIIFQVIQRIFANEEIEYTEDAAEFIVSLTYYPDTISPLTWSCFDLLYKAFVDYAPDFIKDFVPCFDNFIAYGRDVFVSDPKYMQMTYGIINALFTNPESADADCNDACRIAESMLQNLGGHIDEVAAKLIELALGRIPLSRTHVNRVLLLEIVLNACYYNTRLTLGVLEAKQLTQFFMQTLNEEMEHLARLYDKKLAVIGLTNVLSLPSQELPPIIAQSVDQLAALILFMIDAAAKQRHESKTKQPEQIRDLHKAYDLNEDEDAVESETIEYINQIVARIRQMGEDRLHEEDLLSTAIDGIDELLYFYDAVAEMQKQGSPSLAAFSADTLGKLGVLEQSVPARRASQLEMQAQIQQA